MGKNHKKITIFLLTLTIVGVGCGGNLMQNASAMEVDEDGKRWWTLMELEEMNKQAETEYAELCGGDTDCIWEEKMKKMDSGDKKYWAMETEENMKFAISEVNVAENKIKVLYRDEDPMLKRMGIEEKGKIDELYLYWRDEKANCSNFYGCLAGREGSMEGIHIAYKWSVGDENIITPGIENEITLFADAPLIENKNGVIAAEMLENGLFEGGFDYKPCLRDANYDSNKGCRMMIAEDMEIKYFPINDTEVEEEKKEDAPTSETTIEEKKDNKDEIREKGSRENEEKIETENITKSEIKAPDTGEVAEKGEGKQIDYRGLILPIIGLVVLIIWWFLPIKRKK